MEMFIVHEEEAKRNTRTVTMMELILEVFVHSVDVFCNYKMNNGATTRVYTKLFSDWV